MNIGASKNFKTVYHIKNRSVYENIRNEIKSDRKKGYVTIEISASNRRNFPFRKRKSEKKNYELIFQSCQFDKFPACTIKNFSKKRIKGTWTKILFEKLHDATNKLNEKVLTFLKICIIKINNFSNKLKIKNEKIVRDSLKYLNIGNEKMQLNYSNIQKPIDIYREYPKKKLRDNCCRYFFHDNYNGLNSRNLKRGYYEINNNNICTENNFIKCKDLNDLYNKQMNHTNNKWNNSVYSKENIHKFVSGMESNKNKLQNIRNFYVSVISKNTNTKKVRKISLMEICKNPYFFISQDFLSNVESYLVLNHCLLYIKKNHKKMSQIHDNFYSILINVDDINFLEENVSTSILRHIIKRLNSLFQIPTDEITSIEFCLYLRNSDKEEPVHFKEQHIYKYSILIFLSMNKGNYIEFPQRGIRIMAIIGNCLIYECNKNSLGSNIFNFDISEEKIFFLKLNLKYDIHLHRLFLNEMGTNNDSEELIKQNKLTELYGNILKNQNIFSNSHFINNNFKNYNANNMYTMNNHYFYLKKNIESINEKLMELNINHMKNLFLKSSNKLKTNAQ